MSEHKEPIPSMIYNSAVGGHVTNSQQIIDEDYNIEQKDINKEVLGEPYNVSNPNGMGRIILKKTDNFKEVVEAQTNGNTIFIIKYDFTLTGDVTIPANCVLEFDGGSIKNGKLNLNNCYIVAEPYTIFDNIIFNELDTNNGSLEVVDNVYIKVLSNTAYVDRKTNTLIPANTVVNRRYVYKIVDTGVGEVDSVFRDFNNIGQTHVQVAGYSGARQRYFPYFDWMNKIGIVDATGEMMRGDYTSLSGITFYAIAPLEYNSISKVKNKVLYPEWFGAKGDNNNDDSIAINSALDLGYYSDSKVVVGNGIYKINDALVVHTHTELEGTVLNSDDPRTGCFSINTDIGILVFNVKDSTGISSIKKIAFRPFSNDYNHNYIGIKIYNSQNYMLISDIGLYHPKVSVFADAVGPIQQLRCENIALWTETGYDVTGFKSEISCQGWFNCNYFNITSNGGTINCKAIDFKGYGSDNVFNGVNTGLEDPNHYLITLDERATLIVKGALYKETLRFAKLTNSSVLIIEGDSFLNGNVDCDDSSYVRYTSKGVLSRQTVITNSCLPRNKVLYHFENLKKLPSLMIDTINENIINPNTNQGRAVNRYNGHFYNAFDYDFNPGNVNIANKTIILRVLNTQPPVVGTTPIILNEGEDNEKQLYIYKWDDSTTKLDKLPLVDSDKEDPDNSGYEFVQFIERGEQFVIIPSETSEYILKKITVKEHYAFCISDIYIVDEASGMINAKKAKILDTLKDLDSYGVSDRLSGYNFGEFAHARDTIATLLSPYDKGFEFFATDKGVAGVGAMIYYTGDSTTPWVYSDGTAVS